MQRKPLVELLKDLEAELLRLGYTKASMDYYRSRWKRLLHYAQSQNEIYYSEQLGVDYLEDHHQILGQDLCNGLSHKSTQELRVIRMVGDFQLHKAVLRRYCNHKNLLTDPYYIGISKSFRTYCESKDYSKITVEYYVKLSERFMDYLLSQGIKYCHEITLSAVNNYIKTLVGYTCKTVELNISMLRVFLRDLWQKDILKDDLSSKTPKIAGRKQTGIPSVWKKEELDALINAIDRGSPKGKRDYAIIVLACVLGLRVTDIKNLTFDCFHWETNQLVFRQSKTKVIITLPIPPAVGWAVIDYLKYGRPKVDTSLIFVRHLAPFLPFSQTDRLYHIIRGYMRAAKLSTLKMHRGMSSPEIVD